LGPIAAAETSSPDPGDVFTLCASGTAGGLSSDHGYMGAYVPQGATVHLVASGTVQPHPYFAGYWVAQGYLHLDGSMGGTSVFTRSKLIDYYDNPLPPSIPFTWDAGTWTNTTGSDEPILLDMWAAQGGLGFTSVSWSVRVEISGGGGEDLPAVCAGMPTEQTFGSTCDCVGSSTGYQHLTSRPVNTATGSLFETFTDAALPGAGTQLVFTRSYNSLDTTSGPLGPGWTFGFNASVSVDAETGEATVRAEDGKQAIYRSVNGAYVQPPGVRSELIGVSGGGFKLTKPDQSTLEFDADGRLTAMKDRLGVGLTLAYSGGKLASVTDAAGRSLDLSYTGDLLTRLDLGTRHVDYTYDTDGRLASVSDMRGKTTTYAYDTGGRLASALDPNGHYIFKNTYDAATGRISSQLDGRGKQTTFGWDPTTHTATVIDPRNHTWSYVYAGNVLRSGTDSLGDETTYTYDNRLNRTGVTDARGKVTTFTYDTAGNMLTKTGPAPSSVSESWTYTPFNSVQTYTNRRGKTTTYEYHTSQLLKKVTDPLARVTSYTWTSDGLVDTITDPRGKILDLGYDTDGNITSLLSPEGNRTTFGYDGWGRMTSRIEARGNETGANPADYTTTYTYNATNQVTSVTDPLGHGTTYAYDDAGNLDTVTDANNKVTDYDYNADNQVNKVTDPRGGEVATTYDDAGNIASVTTPAGTTTFSYDDANRRTGEITPRGNVTGADPAPFTWTYGFDENGNQTSVSNPTAGTTTTTFDELNRPTSTTDALGKTTTAAYDADSNLTSVTDPLNRTTSYGYDDADQLTAMTDPLHNTTSYAYDSSGNKTSETSPLGNKRTWTFDGAGRQTSEVDPRGNAAGADANDFKTVSTYDAADHLLTVTDPDGHTTSYGYDRVGNLTSRTDANNHTTTYTYDAVDRLSSVIDALNKTTSYAHDASGNLTSRTDANNHTTTYAYDLAGRLTQKHVPVIGDWNYSYDAAGNLTSIETPAGSATTGTPGDGTITRSYDPLDRLTNIDYSDATPEVSYSYNELHRTSMTDGTGLGAETYGYDDAGQVTSVTRGAKVFTYHYDDDGRLTARDLPDGRTITQGWDDDSRPASVNSPQGNATYDYDPAGNRTTTTLGNGIIETRGYDHAGWLTSIAAKNGSTVNAGHAITRDAVGNPTLVAHTYNGAGGQDETYAYDADDRLTQVCFTTNCLLASTIAYTYDPVGNRTQEVRNNISNQGTITSTYNAADQLTQTSATRLLQSNLVTTYGYDANGNQTSANNSDGGTRSYTYDLANRTKSATVYGTATSYAYDGNGLRLSSTTGTATTDYTWDQNYPLPEMVDETTTTGDRAFLLDPDGDPIALTNPGTGTGSGTFYYHPDGIGSIRALTDSTGAVAATYGYEPFGTPRPGTGSTPNPLGFAGEYTDPNTGLSHLRARDYDPTTGRFTALDPIGQDIGDPYVSAYVYASNQPTVYTDPSGLCPMCVVALAGLINAGFDLGMQAVHNLSNGCDAFHNINWREVAASGLFGAATGGLGEALTGVVGLTRLTQATQGLAKGDALALGLTQEGFGKTAANSGGRTLFHYTDEAGLKGITESGKLNPSLRSVNPADARYGNGQYLSDIAPGTKTPAQLSRAFLGQPFQGQRFTHYLELNVDGLDVIQGRANVFVVPGETPLDIIGRIVGYGAN
jgi:RHS repeat-associated protein